MIEYIALVAVIGLVISNILLIQMAFKTKLLEKSEDIFEYTAVTEDKKEPIKNPNEITEVPIY